jgi:hypothetical protein
MRVQACVEVRLPQQARRLHMVWASGCPPSPALALSLVVSASRQRSLWTRTSILPRRMSLWHRKCQRIWGLGAQRARAATACSLHHLCFPPDRSNQMPQQFSLGIDRSVQKPHSGLLWNQLLHNGPGRRNRCLYHYQFLGRIDRPVQISHTPIDTHRHVSPTSGLL